MPVREYYPNVTGSTGFFTHAPMSSMMGGFRPKTVNCLETSLMRSRIMGDSPFLFRRSTSVCGELPSIPLTSRVKSARYTYREAIAMPRSHVSVARFYDWSEDPTNCYSVSRLYREIANNPTPQPSMTQPNDKINLSLSLASGSVSGVSSVISNSLTRHVYKNPGRLFVRDKKALTRGEREIIEGIYKNRSDLNSKDAIAKLDFQVRSHQEAWQTGKNSLLKNERLDGKQVVKSYSQLIPHSLTENDGEDDGNTEATASSMNPTATNNTDTNNKSTHHSSRHNQAKFPLPRKPNFDITPRSTCSQCQKEQRAGITSQSQGMAKKTYITQTKDGYWDARPSAPPSTPDKVAPSSAIDTYFNSGESLSFEKLLNSKLTSETSVSQIVSLVDASSLKSTTESVQNVENNTKTTSSSPQNVTNGACRTPRDTNKIQKTLNVIQSVLEENSKTFKKQSSSSSGFHSEANCDHDSVIFQTDSHSNPGNKSADSSESESDSKRVKVKVYLPIAHRDVTGDDELSETELLHPPCPDV